MKRPYQLTVALLAALLMAACGANQVEPTPTATPRPAATPIPVEGGDQPTATPEPTAEAAPVDEGPQAYAPDDKPDNVNPLTGIAYPPEEADDRLDRRPLLVRVSAFPPSGVMPHSGLQASDHVWEHVVEGFAITRYTAVVYGNTPERVGSVRSGRPPDLELVPMYEGLYTSSGFSTNANVIQTDPDSPPRMREYMLNAPWRPRNFSAEFGFGDPYNIRTTDRSSPHNLFAVPAEIWAEADARDINQRPELDGLAFDPTAPQGGTPTAEAVVDYAGIGARAQWNWDEASGRWLRTVSGDVSTDIFPHEDTLTGEQLAFTNVVIVYATHRQTNFIEDETNNLLAVEIDLFGEGDATILRDGQRYDVRWVREGSESTNMMRFRDEAGNPFPLDNGNTWFQVVAISGRGDDPEVSFDGTVQ